MNLKFLQIFISTSFAYIHSSSIININLFSTFCWSTSFCTFVCLFVCLIFIFLFLHFKISFCLLLSLVKILAWNKVRFGWHYGKSLWLIYWFFLFSILIFYQFNKVLSISCRLSNLNSIDSFYFYLRVRLQLGNSHKNCTFFIS